MSLSELDRRTATPVEDEWYCWPARVDWAFYTRMLRLRGEHRVPRLIFLDGSLLLSTPSMPHEIRRGRIGRYVTEVVVGCGIPCLPTASTTWRRRGLKSGVEGDLTYYIAHEPQVRKKKRITLRDDPPPDLAVEVVYSHDADEALEIYRRLGVPEVWVATERGFTILGLTRRGNRRQYEPVDRSLAFPFLPAEEIADWIGREVEEGETRWTMELRRWVRDELAPRRAAEGGAQ